MGCCQTGRQHSGTIEGIKDAGMTQGNSEAVHLMLIKAYRERDSSRLLPLLHCEEPLKVKFRSKKIERVSSLVCYMLAAFEDQYSVLVKSGTVGKLLEMCSSDKHALCALYLIASQSEEVLQRISDFSPVQRLLPILEHDKQSALITALLLGLLCSLTPAYALTVVKQKGVDYGLQIYSQLHHFEAKRDLLKAIYSVVRRAQCSAQELQTLISTLEPTRDLGLQHFRRLLQTHLTTTTQTNH